MSASVYYDDPRAALDWLCRAFGFELRLKVEGDDGALHHTELTFGESVIMVGAAGGTEPWNQSARSPKSMQGGFTHALCFYLDDVEAHYARAVANGARIVREPATNDYGDDYWTDRSYGALDLEGHLWWFMQRLRNPRERAQ
jgi:uncharacterized glyoxalase superfamily protein PhnB